jgi:acrylyl-CoA reductase (NADPH)
LAIFHFVKTKIHKKVYWKKMEKEKFKALVVRETSENKLVRKIEERSIDQLPAGDVLVKVLYSSLNYKDALSASGNKGVTRHYPHTPGVDAAGVVVESGSSDFSVGDEVLVSCYGLGMSVAGGFGQFIRVPTEWVMNCPPGTTLRESMIYGTAGFTAAHSIYRLRLHGVLPTHGKILVTGASGGVGSMSVCILAKLGYQVVAVSGKESAKTFLMDIGAQEVLGRDAVQDHSSRAILKGKWAGVIDTVGGSILATAIKSTKYGGAVTCCGNVAEPEFMTNVYPFILRGVSLIGIDSAECPMKIRKKIWELLAREWRVDDLEKLCQETSLVGLDAYIEKILVGKNQGRVVVDLWK